MAFLLYENRGPSLCVKVFAYLRIQLGERAYHTTFKWAIIRDDQPSYKSNSNRNCITQRTDGRNITHKKSNFTHPEFSDEEHTLDLVSMYTE